MLFLCEMEVRLPPDLPAEQADELKARDPQVRVVFVGTPRGLESRLVPKAGYELEMLPILPLNGVGLARMLKTVLTKMNQALETPAYNLIIHSTPFSEPQAGDYYHWHVELMPKLTRTAGFEWGTGFYINPTSPEEAAQVLRDARVPGGGPV